jgi:hypothetical protein
MSVSKRITQRLCVKPEPSQQWLSTSDAAHAFGLTRHAIVAGIKDGRIPAKRMPGSSKYWIPASFIETLESPPDTANAGSPTRHRV